MEISVELGSPLDQFAGVDRIAIELPDQATGANLTCQLQEHFGEIPAMKRLLVAGRIILFVNQEYATSETVLREQDQVTIIPYIPCCHP